MSTAKNRNQKSKKEDAFDKAFDAAIGKAMKAKPEDVKVHITCRLDADIYLELKRRADNGEGSGRYQTLMNQLLRSALFETETDAEEEDDVVRDDPWTKLERFIRDNKPTIADRRAVMHPGMRVMGKSARLSRSPQEAVKRSVRRK